jgi:hypothetical protein
MHNDWEYSGLQALGSGQKSEILDHLFNGLYEWTKSVTKTYHEFPAGYTEWTLTGHMNIVSYLCGFLPYSDYSVKILTKQHKGLTKNSVRPDLHIHSKDWESSCFFELKGDFISLTSRANIPNHILAKITDAYNQLKKVAKGDEEWAQYMCAALGFTVGINWLVNGKDRWQKHWSDPKNYEKEWDKLLRKKFGSAVYDISDRLSSFGRIYYCGYRMPHSLAKRLYQAHQKYLQKRTAIDRRSLTVGMLWVCAMESWKTLSTDQ